MHWANDLSAGVDSKNTTASGLKHVSLIAILFIFVESAKATQTDILGEHCYVE